MLYSGRMTQKKSPQARPKPHPKGKTQKGPEEPSPLPVGSSGSHPGPKYWLFKSEPSTYSFLTLLKEGRTAWNGVRNFQARNFLRETRPGDWVLIYHSGDERAVVGLAQVNSLPYPDPDPKKKGDWLQVDIAAVAAFPNSVSLALLKQNPALQGLPLIRHTRLSCMPITQAEFSTICKVGELRDRS
jgi:predicted RNA-binding protein with PUA-like domain